MAQYRNKRTGDVQNLTGAVEAAYSRKPHWEKVDDAPAVFLADRTVAELREHAKATGIDLAGASSKADIQARIAADQNGATGAPTDSES